MDDKDAHDLFKDLNYKLKLNWTNRERRYGKFVKLKKHEMKYATYVKDQYNEVGWTVKVVVGLSPGPKREAWLNFKVPGWSKKES